MIEALFVFTGAMCIIAAVKMIGLILGNSMTMPSVFYPLAPTPSHSWILYPSVMFQIWFWAHHVGLFV